MEKLIFGPVPSRRLGLSLGIDLTPDKACTLNCRYCQLSVTKKTTLERHSRVNPDAILGELERTLKHVSPPDWITFSGSGEPTLNSNLGYLIREIRRIWTIPVCVITNGTLISREDVRQELLEADRILPTLSTVFPEVFQTLHEPCPGLILAEILKGYPLFLETYHGYIEFEVFICPGINDDAKNLTALGAYFASLPRLDGIYLNAAVRPPRDATIPSANEDLLNGLRSFFPASIPVTTAFDRKEIVRGAGTKSLHNEDILALLQRHPCSTEQLALALGGTEAQAFRKLTILSRLEKVRLVNDDTWAPIFKEE